MAALPTTNLTLADWAKRRDPDGSIAVIANLLSQTNEILTDMVVKEGNLPTGHQVSVATGLPAVYWRSVNEGIPPSKATTAQVTEALSILEARSEVDIDVAKLNDDVAGLRLSEARMFIEAMNQQQARTIFYGNPASDPKEYLGLTYRYNNTAAGNAQNLVDAGGASGNTNASVWLVNWGDETVFSIFPKGSAAGLIHEDLGIETIYQQSSAGTGAGEPSRRMRAYVDWFQWKHGLVVKDWRHAVRIHSIEVSDLGALTNEAAPTVFTNLLHQMAKAVYRIPNMEMGRAAFYMNRTVHSGLSRLAMEKSQSVLGINQGLSQFGTPRTYMDFLGIPIRRCDILLNTEARPA